MRRCFVVGCPRSGTTLLQIMLAKHPDIVTIPESHFFQKIRGRWGRRRWPSISPRAAAGALDALSAAATPKDRPDVPIWWPGPGRYASAFRRIMDGFAGAGGAEVWVEKSPVHLHYVDFISRHIPDACYVHVLRDGRDVVASLVDLCERDPERWVAQLVGRGAPPPERPRLIEAAVARWNEDLRRSVDQVGNANHLLVHYEDLVVNTREVLEEVCAFLGVEYRPTMERHWEAAAEVVGPRAGLSHMEKTFQPLEDRRLQRFPVVFTPTEQERVTAGLFLGGDPRAALDQHRASR